MRRKKQHYINGALGHRRTETDCMNILLDAVPVEDWRDVVIAAVAAAKAGDAAQLEQRPRQPGDSGTLGRH